MTVGVIAQDLQRKYPELVLRGADGFLRVNYGGIPLPSPAVWAQIRGEA